MRSTLTSTTREQWLQSAISDLRPDIKHAGLILPRIVHVSIGFPSTRALVSSRRRIGECWQGEASRDGNPHIYISPVIESATEVLGALIHELIRAAYSCNVYEAQEVLEAIKRHAR